jgi:DNA-binding winged helix-turn-helix (wHTH) protein/TolB-like protein
MPATRHVCVRFGVFEIDADARVLLKSGVKIRLQEQPFEVLLTLLESPGEIVTREQLRQRLWPQGTFVEFDHALNTAVKKIRAALCDDAASPRYIETIPRRGYRFLAALDTSESTLPQLNAVSIVRASRLASWRRFRSAILAFAIALPFLSFGGWVILRASAPKNVTLAVLPFSNLNPASSDEPAVTAFQKLLLQQLRRTHPARVVIRGSARKPIHVLLLGSEEQSEINFVLQGGVLRDEQHLHATVQLVRLSDQECVWARDFDRDSNLPQAEIEIAEEAVAKMQSTLAMLGSEPR